jgi:hypothetical protein
LTCLTSPRSKPAGLFDGKSLRAASGSTKSTCHPMLAARSGDEGSLAGRRRQGEGR